jgi:hypothetical protein
MFKIKNFHPFMQADGAEGGYMVSPEQFASAYAGESDPVVDSEPVQEEADTYEQNSEEPTIEEAQPNLFDLGEHGQVTMEDILAWKNGHMMQSDYSRKTQELARQRDEMQREFQTQQQKFQEENQAYLQLGQLLDTNPHLAEEFGQLLHTYFNGNVPQLKPVATQQPQQVDISQDPKFQEMQQFVQQMQEQQTRQQIESEWNTLFAKFPDAKDPQMQQQLAKTADENGINLEMAYKFLNFDKVAQKTATEMAKTQKMKQVAKTVTPSNATGGQVDSNNVVPKSFKEIPALLESMGIDFFKS